jgi:hypothetical protein
MITIIIQPPFIDGNEEIVKVYNTFDDMKKMINEYITRECSSIICTNNYIFLKLCYLMIPKEKVQYIYFKEDGTKVTTNEYPDNLLTKALIEVHKMEVNLALE